MRSIDIEHAYQWRYKKSEQQQIAFSSRWTSVTATTLRIFVFRLIVLIMNCFNLFYFLHDFALIIPDAILSIDFD